MTNIASNESQAFDVTGAWVTPEHCRLTFRLNEDGAGDTEIDYLFDRFDLVYLQHIIESFVDAQPRA